MCSKSRPGSLPAALNLCLQTTKAAGCGHPFGRVHLTNCQNVKSAGKLLSGVKRKGAEKFV